VIVLAIETATPHTGVALGGEGGTLAAVELGGDRTGHELIVALLDRMLAWTGTELAAVGGIAVDVGPGLYTGMRVGIATAKAMAMALHLPLVGICSLDLLAHPLRHGSKVIAGVIDARKGEVFYALYRPSPSGAQRVTEPRTGSIDDFNADVMARGEDVVAVGDGAWRYRDELTHGIELVDLAHPSASALAQLARERTLAGDLSEASAELVQPMYLRAPDAQINWSTR
jgi:tRNA threonylcarbamoyladenosine biosynthesis protein TsaB